MVFLLLICTSAYAHQLFPSIMDRNKDGLVSFEAHIHCAAMASRNPLTIYQCLRPLLEVRADRGTFKSLHKHMLPAHGSKLASSNNGKRNY